MNESKERRDWIRRAGRRRRVVRVAGVLAPSSERVASARGALPVAHAIHETVGGAAALSHPIDVNRPDWPAVDQGRPGTCVAFGVAACVEHLEYESGRPAPNLSEQFLYWAIKHASNDNDNFSYRTKLAYAAQALETMGICDNGLMPYRLRLVTGANQTVSGPAPSATAMADGLRHRHIARFYRDHPGSHEPIPHAAATIWQLLLLKRPVAICFPTFSRPGHAVPSNWDNQGLGAAYGIVADPMQAGYVEESGSHCVCVTGFDPGVADNSGPRFIVRNSWGTADWGQHGGEPNNYPTIPQRGYGSISVDYVNKYCWEMLQL